MNCFHGHPSPLSGSSVMFSLSAFLAIFSPCWVVSLSLSLISEPFWPSIPLLGRFLSKWQRPFVFMHELYLIRFAKKFFDLFSSLFPQTNTFHCTFVFSASLAQTFVPCWVKVHYFLPLAYPTHTFWLLPSLSRIIFLWFFFPSAGRFLSLTCLLSFPPFWPHCYAYDCRYDDIIFSRFPLFTHKSFLHFNVSRYFGFSSLEF